MEETLYSKLETTALFSGLTANAIEEQLKSLHYSLQKVPAKTLFMAEHQPLHEMILVLEGKVSARMGSSRSKSLMVDYLKPGFMLAPAFILSDHNQLPVEVRAVEESTLFCMPKADFSQLINTNSLVLFNFLDILSNINCFLMNKIRMIYMASIKEKVASFLANPGLSKEQLVPGCEMRTVIMVDISIEVLALNTRRCIVITFTMSDVFIRILAHFAIYLFVCWY